MSPRTGESRQQPRFPHKLMPASIEAPVMHKPLFKDARERHRSSPVHQSSSNRPGTRICLSESRAAQHAPRDASAAHSRIQGPTAAEHDLVRQTDNTHRERSGARAIKRPSAKNKQLHRRRALVPLRLPPGHDGSHLAHLLLEGHDVLAARLRQGPVGGEDGHRALAVAGDKQPAVA
mmetsp:Transcript_9505/g.26052  ORF Transcript_9505/g.26052 Transcript_9505/m.26052 type:complete len:177 (+) Transcript_9505:115-645(+)